MFSLIAGGILKLLGVGAEVGAKYVEKKQEMALAALQGEIDVKKAETEAKVKFLLSDQAHTQNWEMVWAEQAKESYKDEFWTAIWAMPFILGMLPWDWAQDTVARFYNTLEAAPQWYTYTLMTIVFAAFGIRLTTNIWEFFKKK